MGATLDTGLEVSERRTSDRRLKRGLLNTRHLGFGARRRSGGRRRYDHSQYVDWYEADLMVLVLGIISLSLADAVITLRLLEMGAVEANVLMAQLIEKDVRTFVGVKVALTCLTIVLLVVHKNFRLIKLLSVKTIIWLFLGLYAALVAYEVALLKLIPMIENPENWM